MFSNPTVKVYHALPPSKEELSEVLAFVFLDVRCPQMMIIKEHQC